MSINVEFVNQAREYINNHLDDCVRFFNQMDTNRQVVSHETYKSVEKGWIKSKDWLNRLDAILSNLCEKDEE
jgi:hypothetical protein